MARLGFECLRRFLPVSTVKLLQVARDALLDLRHTPLHLGACEVPVTVVYRLELAAVDRHAGLREKAHRAAKRNKPGADLADGAAVVLAEVGDRLVIGSKPARQPHHLNVAPSFTLQSPARLDPVEIAVDVELQQHRWMIRGPAGYLGFDPVEPKLSQIEFIDKDVADSSLKGNTISPHWKGWCDGRRLHTTDGCGAGEDRAWTCLLYTSPSPRDLLCVDLGGRRIIKQKKYKREK